MVQLLPSSSSPTPNSDRCRSTSETTVSPTRAATVVRSRPVPLSGRPVRAGLCRIRRSRAVPSATLLAMHAAFQSVGQSAGLKIWRIEVSPCFRIWDGPAGPEQCAEPTQ